MADPIWRIHHLPSGETWDASTDAAAAGWIPTQTAICGIELIDGRMVWFSAKDVWIEVLLNHEQKGGENIESDATGNRGSETGRVE